VSTDSVINNDGVRIAVRDYGGKGRPLVLVHGGPGQNLAAWDALAPLLAPELHAVALDMRGNGASDDADDYSWPALASDIHAVARAFELEQPVLVGHSWGGQLVTYYASQYDDCAGVVAIDGWITDVYTELGDDVWRWMEERYAAEPFLRFEGTAEDLNRAIDLIVREYGAGASGAAVARRQFAECADGMFRWRRTVAALVHIQRTIDEEARVLSSKLFARTRCPVLLIGGDRSETEAQSAREGRLGEWGFSRAATDPIVAKYEHVRAEWWPCGHDIPGEMPEELAARIKAFISIL
jgi:pimeloyl-ACP methyl ester carboxylesterase